MKLTYLGTAAAEGFPALFCNCEYCKEARKKGGKNIRTRSQAMINDDLLIDFPADAYMHALLGEYRFDKIKTLIFTHSHADHCYTHDLRLRHKPYAHNMEHEKLKIYCGQIVYDLILHEQKTTELEGIELHVYKPFVTFKADGYSITPLPARHMGGKGACIFVIEKGGKCILYANDTGYLLDETFEYIQKQGLYFDFVSYDCTHGDMNTKKTGSHMGFSIIEEVREKLRNMGAIDDKTIEFVHHFSHNCNPDHERLESIANNLGMGVSYDGCSVEI